ncbi:MAG TPA: metallophosphoesterase [Phycisphaerae bacterium]|nr:metallophosphoesterase [Phycisphaerae bacterium]
MKILHTADSHIGAELPVRARLPGPRRGDDFIAAFHRVLQTARDQAVDLVIHAGDLFDSPRPSRSAIMAAVLPLRDLAGDGIPVLIVPGNHERCAIPESPFLCHPNIHIAADPMTRLFHCGGTRVAVSAIPCLHHAGQARFEEQLAAASCSSVAADVRMLAVHQAFDSAVCGSADYRFPRKDPDVILRGQVPPEFVYVAAGHVHRHQKLRPADRLTPQIVYSG